ncbi:efflux RND transporter permease subunit [Flavobacterium sp. FPG59]|jgi:HAE1 family hydrophobic/amphiphilic exporter-1|uniref:efflux RND transporter permease subunit n=1 Tax=Flavobacterium sp. FPG59 TaxID=1929267 RepID=UPI000A3AF055|nr:efflux RND transporter permease subunit [Flavobacterium sp. FPG59]OUD36796.1 multidrug transporter AcrB [Flavobacterium sp. FPG59]
MFSKFIHRPVLSIVISLLIVLLGVVSLTQLPMTQFPDIAPPEVTVTTKYTGANAEACVKAVVVTLERAVNGVPGMAYMSSVSGNDGTSVINIIFKAGTDPEIAAVNVQNRVSAVLDELPEEVIKSGVIVEKVQNSMLLYLNVLSSDPNLDEKFLYNFADINILPELKRIEGVGFADIMGQREYAMRVWLNPVKMAAYKISTEDIVQSLKQQNIEAAPGKIGESSGKVEQSLQYVVKYAGKYNTKEQYENVVIKRDFQGELLRLKDVADIEFGSLDYDVLSKENGKPSAAIVLKQRPGSNASDVIQNIKTKMDELQKSFPAGISYTYSYDVSNFLTASIEGVLFTLVEAFLLVALVVFIFLGDFRSTVIPAIAVPISLVGTFFFMQLFGFSINLITLFALVLAIGIVVDNAIVVVEAVHAKMEELHIDAKAATEQAMKEIGGAIIAITLVMSAVFIPVAFLPGPTGVFYKQFSITMAIAIVLSGISALTLTPALCAMLLKNTHGTIRKKTIINRFIDKFNEKYNLLAARYRKLIELIVNRRVVTGLVLLFFCFATVGLGNVVPSGFIPNEDQGTIYASITTPSGATLERSEDVVDAIQKIALQDKNVSSVSTLAGYNFLTDGTGASYGMNLISLKSWEERNGKTDQDVINELKDKTTHIKDAKIEFFTPPPVPGYGNSSGFELRILDKTGKGDLKKLEEVATNFANELNKNEAIRNTFSSFDASFPQFMVNIDNAKAAQKGVNIKEVLGTLQTYLGSDYATNFIRFNQMYKVMVQSSPEFRAKPEDILKLYTKNLEGEMVAMSSFLSIEKVYGPEQITRYNMYPAAMLNGEPMKGYSSGQAITAIKKIAEKKLPKGYGYDWGGSSREQANAGNEAIFIFLICLLFIYLLLAAQYESFSLPFAVILSLPTGVFGAFFLLAALGLENNIYAQVAMIMLIGLLGKNAILIIEFAILKNKEGLPPFEAAIEGAVARLRPILMTSFAFIAGLIPLMIATGAGAIGNKTIGTAAAGGMLFGTVFGIIIIPGLYFIFASISERFSKKTTN